MDIAIKILAVVLGVAAAFASYPYLDALVAGFLAFLGAVAVGFIAGALVERVLNYVFIRSGRLS